MSNRFIYKCSWFETKRHKISHTDMYYEKAEHTEWVFKTTDWSDGLAKVDYVMVTANSEQYRMAVETSNIAFWKNKQEQLMKEFEKHRIQECVVCYESTNWCDGTRCRTCKNSTCHKCYCEYLLANLGKFPTQSDETGYSVECRLPCPMCRTDNLFMY